MLTKTISYSVIIQFTLMVLKQYFFSSSKRLPDSKDWSEATICMIIVEPTTVLNRNIPPLKGDALLNNMFAITDNMALKQRCYIVYSIKRFTVVVFQGFSPWFERKLTILTRNYFGWFRTLAINPFIYQALHTCSSASDCGDTI